MVDEKQIAEWRKYYRQSICALPVGLGLLIALALGLFGLSFLVSLPTWLTIVVLGSIGFAVIGDAINIVYLGHKLRQKRFLKPDEPPRSTP